jgi:hypothetical protein
MPWLCFKFQARAVQVPSFDPWPDFLSRPDAADAPACKVSDEDHVETEVQTVAIVPPVEGDRPELRFNDLAPFLHQLQFQWDTYAAVEREEEGRVMYVQTWYTDHTRARHCHAPRPVRLNAAAWEWPDAIAEVWDDLVDPDAAIDLFLIRPTPRRRSWNAEEAVPHVLMVQHPQRNFKSVHLMVVDVVDADNPPRDFVMVVPALVDKHIFYDILGIGHERMVSSLVDCMISHGDITINEGDVYEAQHGYSFIVILNHMRDIMTRAAAGYASASSSSLQ